jgi:hypothetical protein
MKLMLPIIVILGFFSEGCLAQSKLPPKMPEKVSFSLYEGGGMARSYKRIRIEEGNLEFEELIDNQIQKWKAKVSEKDVESLYQTFVKNSFDLIRNDVRKEIVYDAGSETISLSIGIGKSYNVTYGKNSPLSGKNLRRFEAVSKAIDKIIEGAKK